MIIVINVLFAFEDESELYFTPLGSEWYRWRKDTSNMSAKPVNFSC